MKIILSKQQWKKIGIKAGWVDIPCKWVNKGAFDPLWNVTHIKDGVFRLSYQNIPIQDYSLTTNQNGKYDGNVKEIKTYGFNYITKVPNNVRIPIILEMFSRAKDIIDKQL